MHKTKTATLLKTTLDDEHQTRSVFRLTPPLDGHKVVVVSAIGSAFDTGIPETYIFPGNEEGDIIDWTELPGSKRGFRNIQRVLNNAGYEVIK